VQPMNAKRKWLVIGGRWQAVSSQRPPANGDQSSSESGFTLLELIITMTIIAILVAGTVPVANNMIKREKERELRRNLREIRMAIDTYNNACKNWPVTDLSKPAVANGETEQELKCYPKDLMTLVDGIPGPIDTQRFLRRIPKDPFANPNEDPKNQWETIKASETSSGNHVFDVRSKSQGTALDGTKYGDW